MKVLIVEDDATNRFIANKLFEADFEMKNAKNSLEALNAVDQEVFDAILIDLKLGSDSLSGEQLMQELRNHKNARKSKLIAVSSYSLPEEAGDFIRAGFDMFLSKPYSRQKMVESIKGLIAQP